MLDAFLKFPGFLDELIKLIKLKERNRASFFKEIIEPLFLELQPVVDDQFRLVRRARTLATNGSNNDFQDAINELRDARESLLQQRIKVRAMAKTMQEEYKDHRIKSFATKIEKFFYSTGAKRFRKASDTRYIVGLFDYVMENNEIPRNELIERISRLLLVMEDNWIAIAQSYASLRLYCLQKP